MPLLVSLDVEPPEEVPDVPLPEVPDEEPLEGVSIVVVVVVTVPELPEEPDDPDVLLSEVAAPDFAGSPVVVVVVVWPNVIVAVPSSDRKIAMGNFFMLAP